MVDVLGMCIYASPDEIVEHYATTNIVRDTIFIFGVGFEVAYLYVVASSKARIVR